MTVASNGLRRQRVAAGLTQQQLAQRVSVTRQTIGAIESGVGGCGVGLALRLAAALECRVEDLFEAPGTVVAAELVEGDAAGQTATRVALGEIRGRMVARPLRGAQGRFWATQPAQGLVRGRTPRGAVEVSRLRQDNGSIFLAGCDPAAGLLAEHVSRGRAARDAYWWPAGNARAIAELRRGDVHAAAVHQELGATAPDFGFAVERIRLASWEMGWIVARGNPKELQSAGDLDSRSVVLANREPGSGARRLLDELLQRAGVPPVAVRGYERVFLGHAEVATAVKLGVADIGLGIAVAAQAEDLGFVAVARHVCDLYVPRDQLRAEPVDALLNALASGGFRRDLAAFGPYETSQAGDRIG